MPRIARTVIPRIRKSLRERGLAASLGRSFLLPVHLWQEYRATRKLRPDAHPGEFDRTYGVDTEGDLRGWTYLSDLDIPSPNWIDGTNYTPILPQCFERIMASLEIAFEDYTFIDFGSGKGRALLLASHFGFRQIIGLEFSPQLHIIAQENIRHYRSPRQKCTDIQSLNVDFVDFALPKQPSVLFFFDPCREPVLKSVLAGIQSSLAGHPRQLHIAYVAPRPEQERLFRSAPFLREALRSAESNFCIYQSWPPLDSKP
jgi:SAM-dependent methyltransferase